MEGGEEITINIIMVCITIVLIITICKHGEEQVVGEKEEEEERDLWRGVDSSRGRRWAVEIVRMIRTIMIGMLICIYV